MVNRFKEVTFTIGGYYVFKLTFSLSCFNGCLSGYPAVWPKEEVTVLVQVGVVYEPANRRVIFCRVS